MPVGYTPGVSGLLSNFLYQKLPQYQAATGNAPTAGMVQGLLGADLQGAKQQAMENYYRGQQLALMQQQFKAQQDATHKRNQFARLGQAFQLAQVPFALLGGAAAAKTQLGLLGMGGSGGGGGGGGFDFMGAIQPSINPIQTATKFSPIDFTQFMFAGS